MVISIVVEKAFDKIQHQNSQLSCMDGTYLNIVKAIYDIPTPNVILKGKMLKTFSLRSGRRQG